MAGTRRTWLKTVALGSVPMLYRRNGTTGPQAGAQFVAPPTPFRPLSSLENAFEGPVSAFFGILPDQRAKQSDSFYSTKSAMPERLSFDVSNNYIQCSISQTGTLDRLCILTGVLPAEVAGNELRGVFATKELIRGGPWSFRVRLQGKELGAEGDADPTQVDLLGNLFPVFTSHLHNLRMRLLAFAPVSTGAQPASPRGVIVILELKNESSAVLSGSVSAPSQLKDVAAVNAEATQAVALVEGSRWRPAFPEVGFELAPGQLNHLAFACMLGENGEELRRTAATLQSKPTLEWLNETWQFHSDRLGQVSIPGDPFYAESMVRMEEVARQSVLRMADGTFGAGFWGSDVAEPTLIWNKDNFYAMLPMSMLEPQLCADAILYFLKWGMPPRPIGRGVKRFPEAGPVTQSLGNSLSGLVLAGAYYQMTGDHSFFRAHPEILATAQQRLQEVLDSRREKPFLFPSMYVSDGDARGDFHTGSNLIVWFAFQNMARIARDVYREKHLAGEWELCAQKVKAALLEHCIGNGPLGKQFYEGATADLTFILGHDGEESDATLMPFYGFREADDPACVNHARVGLSPINPYYAPVVEGIWWYDAGWTGSTFPGFTTALAGIRNEKELAERLRRIRQLADLDGSIWWWPYKHKEANLAAVVREPGKCGWAAAVYLCKFIHDILGLRLDVPHRKVSFRPFAPWPQFTWNNCRLGSTVFDVRYLHRQGEIVAEITNNNRDSFEGLIEVVLPESASHVGPKVNGLAAENLTRAERYGRPAVRVTSAIPSAQSLRLDVSYL